MAGLFVLLAPSALRIDLLSPFLDFWTATSNERLLGTIIWYAIAGAALIGGVLATVTPGFAALLLIGAAAGWLAVAISVPQLFTYHLLAPAGTAGLAALFAFLAGELQVRRRRLARRNRKLAAEAPEEDNSEFEREAALRMDPMLMPRQDAPPPPKRAIPLTLEDVTVTSRPTSMPPRWQDLDAEQPPRRHDPGMWAEARREQLEPETEAARGRVAPEPRAEMWEREPEPRRREPERRERNQGARYEEPEVRRREPEARREPQRQRVAARAERGNAWVAALTAICAVLVIAIIAAGGYLINRDGSLDALFGPSNAPTVVASSEAPATASPETVANAPAATVKLQLPATPATSTNASVAAATSLSGASADTAPTVTALSAPAAATPGVAVAPLESEPTTGPARVAAAAPPETYDDPFAYCRAVGTIDYVDNRYSGPATVTAMTSALLIPASSARDRVRWRCFEGAVLACTSYIGPICDMAPTVQEMREFCERNPNVEQLLAPSGTWACVDGKPQLPANASWPIDSRGFLPQGWIAVSDPGSATAG
ncbi:hypothetical protein VW23_009340 [Devosia insulae DS-56]|uniref:Uncharacterized protein n=2 Tax=Devosia insulae TaxID=408174 RepID=A0A1E5XWD7_9HYPH|nr:hypothetical protein VW23_009340 [Devosia insulae DS-56]